MHPDQLHLGLDTVRALLSDQLPHLAGHRIREVSTPGTVNAVFRIGDGHAARFPLQPGDLAVTRRWLEGEAAAARELHGRTPFPTPEPVAIGDPGHGYPLPWSVQTWVPGTVATLADPGSSLGFAQDLASFVLAVRSIDTRGRSFAGGGRGGDLRRHEQWMQTCLARSEGLLDVPRLRRAWASFRDLPRGDAPDGMSHGDLVPGNVLVSGARLAGVIDVGGFGAADPALELVAAWHLLDAGPRQVLRDELGCTDLEWERGRAWAFVQAIGLVWCYARSNPTVSLTGRRTLDRVLAAPAAARG